LPPRSSLTSLFFFFFSSFPLFVVDDLPDGQDAFLSRFGGPTDPLLPFPSLPRRGLPSSARPFLHPFHKCTLFQAAFSIPLVPLKRSSHPSWSEGRGFWAFSPPVDPGGGPRAFRPFTPFPGPSSVPPGRGPCVFWETWCKLQCGTLLLGVVTRRVPIPPPTRFGLPRNSLSFFCSPPVLRFFLP